METPLDEDPGLEGPDYVALVIEWDEMADVLERGPVDELADSEAVTSPIHRRRPLRWIAALAGIVGAVALARWGIHRRRACA
jgi:hypothetical protein